VNFKDPRVDILVIVYNHELTIQKCLLSILNQTHTNLFITLIDDCSTDGSWSIINEIRNDYPERIVAEQTPFNVGAEKIKDFCNFNPKGDFWGIIEGDDWWIANDKLELQINELNYNPKFIGCSGTTLVVGPQGNELYKIKSSVKMWNYLDYLQKVDGLYIHVSSILWRNIFKDRKNFFPKALQKGWPDGEWPLTLAMLSESGGWLLNIESEISVYNFSGFGIWTSQDKSVRDQQNKRVQNQIWRKTPYWQKVLMMISYLGLRKLSNNLLYQYARVLNYIFKI
jgi:glycosyltransferase involved in cell wall biosynthesis